MSDPPGSQHPDGPPSPPQGPVERVRGMADVLPADYAFREGVLGTLRRHFAAHGYRPVDTPVVEATELFLRKSGEERAAQMYAFAYRNRQIALRPEFTASIVRAYVAAMQGLPLPLRLSYCGPVFRYEKPQAGRSRQYTEAGVELLGAAGPAADAEVIHLALAGLAALGLDDCTLRLGHLGAVGVFLASLPLDERVRDWFLWSMERLRARGDDGLHRGLRALLDREAAPAPTPGEFPGLDDLLPGDAGAERIGALVLDLLRAAGVDLDGSSRPPEEIVARLLLKLRRPRARFDVARALDFLRRLVALRGAPAAVLDGLRALLADYGLDPAPVGELEQVLDLLRAYGHAGRVELDLGLGRGLHYYTGILFEVYDGRDPAVQLCGGGRYDDLAQVLGARAPVPASGLSYGVERVAAALRARGAAAPEPPAADVLVCGGRGVPMAELIGVAAALRAGGWRVDLDVRGRSLAANLRYADRAGIAHVAILGEDERRAGVVAWHTMATRAQERLPLAALRTRGQESSEGRLFTAEHAENAESGMESGIWKTVRD
ncbi:MAG TPA: ATP phosphoribosyltransferase regulatory subunit [Thermomicrobiales bacterium]|nr:ATP phosphoribosyltransferase regulatory subunit [Thermomicrobiales bacterium]